MLADIIVGLGVVAILATALAISLSRRQAVSDHLADSREATRVAEQTLTALQSGEKVPASDEHTKIDVKPMSGALEIGTAHWVTVQVTHNGRKVSLSGLAKSAAEASTRPAEAGGVK